MTRDRQDIAIFIDNGNVLSDSQRTEPQWRRISPGLWKPCTDWTDSATASIHAREFRRQVSEGISERWGLIRFFGVITVPIW